MLFLVWFFSPGLTLVVNGWCAIFPPFVSYVKGYYSFGLMETCLYDRAEKVAHEVRCLLLVLKGLRILSQGGDFCQLLVKVAEIQLNMEMLTELCETCWWLFSHFCPTKAVSLDCILLLMSMPCQVGSEHPYKIHVSAHLLLSTCIIGCWLLLKNVGLFGCSLLLTISPVWLPAPFFPRCLFLDYWTINSNNVPEDQY